MSLLATTTGFHPIFGRCEATIARSGNMGNNKSRFVWIAAAVEPINYLRRTAKSAIP